MNDDLAALRQMLADDADLRDAYRQAIAEAKDETPDAADIVGGVAVADIADLLNDNAPGQGQGQ